MFKVIKAELKKMVSKPGIFVLAAFLAVILVFGVVFYKPEVRKYEVETIEISVGTFNVSGGYKELADTTLQNTVNTVNSYFIEDGDKTISYYVKMYGEDGKSGLWQKYDEACTEMKVKADNPNADTLVENFLSVLEEINTTLTNAVNGSGTAHLTLVSKDDYTTYTNIYKSVVNSTAEDGVFKRAGLSTPEKITKFKERYESQYENILTKFKFPTIGTEIVENYTNASKEGTYLNTINTRLAKIDSQMQEVATKYADANLTDTQKDDLAVEYNALANNYRMCVSVYQNMLKYELMSNAFSIVNTAQRFDLMNLSDQTEYNSNTQLIRYRYLFNNNKTDADFSNPLAVGSTITNKITAYDYAYFILKLFSFIIIAYAMMSACGAIAGEIKDGSMRYYAIRPINRNNILFGKLISIIVMSTIILIFSTIIAMCVGVGVYGWTNLKILTIFNGRTAIVMHPLVMIGIFMVSFIFELLVYTSIAFLLSTLLKSDLLASTLMLLIYLINIILPVFAGGMNSWLAFYPFSHISLFSLFGSSIIATGNNMLSSLLKVNIYASTSLPLNIFVTILLVVIPLFLAALLFKKKEL